MEYKDDLNDISQSLNNSTTSRDNWKDSSSPKERFTGYGGGILIAECSAIRIPGNLSGEEHSFDDKECSMGNSYVDNFWEGMHYIFRYFISF
jgi:hypothetical protein